MTRWRRALRQGVLRFTGVLLALLARDWFRVGVERDRAYEVLAVLHHDLRIDSTRFVGFRENPIEASHLAAWLSRHRGDSEAPDSASLLLKPFFHLGISDLEVSEGAYRALVASGGLTLIDDPRLRSDLGQFFDHVQPNVVGAMTEWADAAIQLAAHWTPYATFSSDQLLIGSSPESIAWNEVRRDDVGLVLAARYSLTAEELAVLIGSWNYMRQDLLRSLDETLARR